MGARDHLYKCGFSGAIFTYQAMDSISLNLKTDVIDSQHTRETLSKVFYLHQTVIHASSSSFIIHIRNGTSGGGRLLQNVPSFLLSFIQGCGIAS
jgi:hypothetical protein